MNAPGVSSEAATAASPRPDACHQFAAEHAAAVVLMPGHQARLRTRYWRLCLRILVDMFGALKSRELLLSAHTVSALASAGISAGETRLGIELNVSNGLRQLLLH